MRYDEQYVPGTVLTGTQAVPGVTPGPMVMVGNTGHCVGTSSVQYVVQPPSVPVMIQSPTGPIMVQGNTVPLMVQNNNRSIFTTTYPRVFVPARQTDCQRRGIPIVLMALGCVFVFICLINWIIGARILGGVIPLILGVVCIASSIYYRRKYNALTNRNQPSSNSPGNVHPPNDSALLSQPITDQSNNQTNPHNPIGFGNISSNEDPLPPYSAVADNPPAYNQISSLPPLSYNPPLPYNPSYNNDSKK